MKHIHSLLIAALALFVSTAPTQGQEESPQIPVGTLSAFPTIVQTGTHPTLTWSVTIPESVEDIIEIQLPGTLVPKRDVIMDVRILGAGVTVSANNNAGFNFVPTECQINVDGKGYSQIFYGTNNDVNPNDIVYTKNVKEGETVNFGSRYYYNNKWGTWYSTTNSGNNVVALKNGDTPPTTTPMHYAPTIESFIRPYLDEEGKIKIGPRDVLYLMELTHTDRDHTGFDLQDMAVLVTFYDKVNNGHGNNEDGVDSSNPGASKEGEDTDPTVDDEIGTGGGSSSEDSTSSSDDDKKKKKKKRGRRKK